MPEISAEYNDMKLVVLQRQQAFREVNAFDQRTTLSVSERAAAISELTPHTEPDAIPRRMAQFAMLGFNSLDLGRAELDGDWSLGDALDDDIETYIRRLADNHDLQRSIGIAALSHFDKGDARANAHATPVLLGDVNATVEHLHVVRERTVAEFAVRATGRAVRLKKRSDFLQLPAPATPEDAAVVGGIIARGGFDLLTAALHDIDIEQAAAANAHLVGRYDSIVHAAIQQRAPWLVPVNMNYHIAAAGKRNRKRA